MCVHTYIFVSVYVCYSSLELHPSSLMLQSFHLPFLSSSAYDRSARARPLSQMYNHAAAASLEPTTGKK